MSKAETLDQNDERFEFKRIDLPNSRDYEDPDDAELDIKLVEAIKAARKSNNHQLAGELELQLGSHYYGCELGL